MKIFSYQKKKTVHAIVFYHRISVVVNLLIHFLWNLNNVIYLYFSKILQKQKLLLN